MHAGKKRFPFRWPSRDPMFRRDLWGTTTTIQVLARRTKGTEDAEDSQNSGSRAYGYPNVPVVKWLGVLSV